ncbi:MAG: hypothetical protein JXP34_00380, partial [Planctomycetes bacterium]|nr:hypothetical protein [Planctomycetota bacterium]
TVRAGDTVTFEVAVGDVATGHKFPSGSSEERDVWLHVALCDGDGKELQHIPIPPNADDPNDRYFITSNEKVAYPTHSKHSEPIIRDALPEGDRLYHSAFLDSDGKFTYAQWYAAKEVENRLSPGETRVERFAWAVPEDAAGKRLYLKASLWYRRMPDSYAEFLGIAKRPHILVAEDERPVAVVAE